MPCTATFGPPDGALQAANGSVADAFGTDTAGLVALAVPASLAVASTRQAMLWPPSAAITR